MYAIAQLLRTEPRARRFFLAHAQSSLGTGAAYVGLLVLALDRLDSPWAISLVLLADFLPAMVLGPIFGAAADRWPRRTCAVAADLMRAAAFVSLAFVDSFAATLALALLAGVGTGLFSPAVMSGLPKLCSAERLPAGASLYAALADLGYTLGPAVAGLALLVADAGSLMFVNGITFALSALLLLGVPLGAGERRSERRSLVRDARQGVREVAAMPLVSTLIAGGSAVVLFAGLFNVGELLLAKNELGAGEAGFGLLVGIFGFGVVLGSLTGAAADTPALTRRYLEGMAVTGTGFTIAALSPSLVVASAGFFVAGFGNGLVVVHQRLLLQTSVDDALLGRVFGVKDTAAAWAYVLAFLMAGSLIAGAGTRPILALAGGGVLTVAAVSAWALRTLPTTAQRVGGPQPLPHMVERLEPTERAAVTAGG